MAAKRERRQKRVPLGPALDQTDEELEAEALDIAALKRAVFTGWEIDAPEGWEGLIQAEEQES